MVYDVPKIGVVKEEDTMTYRHYLNVLFFIFVFQTVCYAGEVQMGRGSIIPEFSGKIDEFLTTNHFPDAALAFNVKKATIEQDSNGKPFLDVTVDWKYNDVFFDSLERLFTEYKDLLKTEAEKEGYRCKVVLRNEFRVPCDVGVDVVLRKFYLSAQGNNGIFDPDRIFPIILRYVLKNSENKVVQQGDLEWRGMITLYDPLNPLGWNKKYNYNLSLPFFRTSGTLFLTEEAQELYGKFKSYGLTVGESGEGVGKIYDLVEMKSLGKKQTKIKLPINITPEEIKQVEILVANETKWQEDKQRKEEEERIDREKAAKEEARIKTPKYKREVIAEELCQQYEALSQANQAFKHQNEVDLATGTTNLYERRQLGAAKLYLEQEIARLKKEYKKLGGGDFSRKKQCE